MARTMKQRAVLAGLSGGAGLSMPAAAYAVELPFDLSSGGASLVAGAVLPFAVGALAGVAVTGTVAYFSLRAQEREFESHAVYVGAGFEAVPAGDRGSVREDAQPRRQKHGFFAKRAEDDVPVIARAEGALSEEEAWAEIDAALSENPAISCDPVNSKDLYQLALEELAAQASARASAQADAGASQQPAPEEPVAAAAQAASAPQAEVPQADYSGREEIWAAALEVLAEDPSEASITAGFSVMGQAPAESTAVLRRGAHFAPSRPAPRPLTARERSLEVQEHVNEIIEEEFSKNDSQSVRATSRRYLEVVNGGTASWPRLETQQA